jgi:hypothetical protein
MFSPQLNVRNYWEAIGVVGAHKAGVNPNALRRQGIDHLKSPQRLYSAHSSGPRPSGRPPVQEKLHIKEVAGKI